MQYQKKLCLLMGLWPDGLVFWVDTLKVERQTLDGNCGVLVLAPKGDQLDLGVGKEPDLGAGIDVHSLEHVVVASHVGKQIAILYEQRSEANYFST